MEKWVIDRGLRLDESAAFRAGIAEKFFYSAVVIPQGSHKKVLFKIGRRNMLTFDEGMVEEVMVDELKI